MPAKKPAAPAKPTYAVMVTESIKTLADRTGSSVQAITKQLQTAYSIDINKPALLKAIKKGVEQGDFVQIKASYKLAKKPAAATAAVAATATKKAPPTKKAAPKATVKKTRTAQSKTTKPAKTIIKKSSKKTVKTKKSSTRKAATKKSSAAGKKKSSTKK